MSCLLTQQMSCLLTQQMSCLQTQQMSCLQTQLGLPSADRIFLNPDLGIWPRKKPYLSMGGQMLLPNWLILKESYITWCCALRYAHPWPWGSCICRNVMMAKWPPSFRKKRGNPPPWIWQFVDKKNGFGLSDGHIGSSGGEIRGSRTNSAARTLPWPCRALGTSFFPLSPSGDLGPGPSPGPLGALYNSRSTHLGGPVCYQGGSSHYSEPFWGAYGPLSRTLPWSILRG